MDPIAAFIQGGIGLWAAFTDSYIGMITFIVVTVFLVGLSTVLSALAPAFLRSTRPDTPAVQSAAAPSDRT